MRLLTSIALATAALTGCVIESDSSIRVSNRSDFEIHEMYVTPVHASTWGPNLLENDILMPDESMYVMLANGNYDALLIDETGSVCEVDNIDLTFEDADWVIRNSSCALFEQRAAAAAAANAKQ